MKLEDALLNWLQIRLVADARPDDSAAGNTVDFFYSVLTDDHHLTDIEIVDAADAGLLQIRYTKDGERAVKSFDREYAHQLLHEIDGNPKYNDCL